jgi:hypothetical protein
LVRMVVDGVGLRWMMRKRKGCGMGDGGMKGGKWGAWVSLWLPLLR